MHHYRVALVHNIIAPYRVPLFEALARHPSVELQVYYCATRHKIRHWDVVAHKTYSYKVLPGLTLEGAGVAYHINPSVAIELAKNHFDCVIIGGSTDFTTQLSFFVSKAMKVPIILWSEGFKAGETPLAKLIGPITRRIASGADAIIVPGTRARNFHIKCGANPEKVFIAPNTVDTNSFSTKSHNYKRLAPLEDVMPNTKIIVLFVGQLIQRKGVEFLIRAFADLRRECNNISLVIIGDGELRSELEQLVLDEGVTDVTFAGWVDEEEKIKYYAAARLFILPTLQDVWGLVINEAMACSLPVISTISAGCAADMIFEGENGFVVAPGDVQALYEAMRHIMRDEDIRKMMGRKSFEIVTTRFTNDVAVSGFLNAIRFACKDRRS